MDKSKINEAVRAERKALVGDLRGIDPAAWASPSLCNAWSVRDVVAHIAATARITPATFFPKLAASGFKLSRMQEKDIRSILGNSPADTLSALEAVVDRTGGPPGPADTVLGEVIVHSEDIRRCLGIHRSYPAESLAAVGDFYARSNLIIGGKKRIAGLSLRATDSDWSTVSGPEVTGPLLALVMTVAGRGAAYRDELSGPGVARVLAA